MSASRSERIDGLLARARLNSPPYSARELAAAEGRLAARLGDRMLHGALSFDDAVQATQWAAQERPEAAAAGQDRQEPAPAAYRRAVGPDPAERRRMREAAADLRRLCRLLVGQPDALHQMVTFIGDRVLEPSGARVLACVLQLAGREDSARFWWQYAAGAGDTCAAYCLYLHHMALAEVGEAHWWHAQADPDRTDHSSLPGRTARTRPCAKAYDLVITWAVGLEVELAELAAQAVPSAASAAVVGYVSTAVEYVDELDLPLLPAGFAQRIEELTGP